MTTEKIKALIRQPAFRWSALAMIWLVAFAVIAVPSWRKAMSYHREVQELEKGLAELDTWTVAGMWLGKNLGNRADAMERAWTQTFPSGRLREELFLELALVADHSGVAEFKLEEIETEGVAAFLVSPPQESTFGGSVYGVPVEVPRVTLENYRVKASFQGNYQQATRFIGGLQSIKRAVSVHNLVARPGNERITIDLELDIYVSQQS